jgi:hypothetical protein
VKPISGYLMSRDEKIARIEKNELLPLKSELLPLYLQRGYYGVAEPPNLLK